MRNFLKIILMVWMLFLTTTSFAFFNFHISHPDEEGSSSFGMMTSIKDRLVKLVRETVSTLHYSHYKLGGTYFDVSKGVYVVDCSAYVDRILRTVCPNAYNSLASSTGSDKPTTQDYYHFFSGLSYANQDYWTKIDNVKNLEPGDILVFRTESHIVRSRHHRHRHVLASAAGHVMIVMSKPIFDTGAFLVRVADSASAGHGDDTRSPHVSGIGIGTLLLKVNPKTGQPYAYAWNFDAFWKKNVKFAMARPKDLG